MITTDEDRSLKFISGSIGRVRSISIFLSKGESPTFHWMRLVLLSQSHPKSFEAKTKSFSLDRFLSIFDTSFWLTHLH